MEKLSIEELWKDIEGYKGYYQVSNLGRIKRLRRSHTGKNNVTQFYTDKIMSISLDNKLYQCVGLRKNGISRKFLVHRLIAKAFIENPNNKPFINHKNGVRDDNRLENLEWCTPKENSIHSVNELNRKRVGKLSKEIYFDIMSASGKGYRLQLSDKYNLSVGYIKTVRSGSCYKNWYNEFNNLAIDITTLK